jgi:N-methylhydantoinase A
MTYRLGVDVGGTFTDVLLIDERTGGTYRAKTASTPDDQSVGVLRGIEKVCGSAGITLADIAQVLHGTTVATNAILEGKGSRPTAAWSPPWMTTTSGPSCAPCARPASRR